MSKLSEEEAAIQEFLAKSGRGSQKQHRPELFLAGLGNQQAFYKSPLGQKMLVQEPLVLDEAFNYVQQWAPRLGEEVMNRFRAEMKKKGHDL